MMTRSEIPRSPGLVFYDGFQELCGNLGDDGVMKAA